MLSNSIAIAGGITKAAHGNAGGDVFGCGILLGSGNC